MRKERTIYFILRTLMQGKTSYWNLIRENDTVLPEFISTLKELVDEGYVAADENGILYLTDKGKKYAEKLGIRAYVDPVCEHCKGKTVLIKDAYKPIYEEFLKIAKDRPKAITAFDQGYVTPEDTIRRVLLMHRFGDVENKKILILGDDDLTSIALALTGLPKEILVLEIDERLINFINKVAEERGWTNVKAMSYDARYPFSEEIQGQYDTFVTDPVETVKGITLFLSRCIQGLKGEGSAGYFGLTHIEASRKKWHAIQKNLLDMNLVVTDIIRRFSDYALENEDIVKEDLNFRVYTEAPVKVNFPDAYFYTSNMYRVELIDAPKPIFDGKVEWERDLYLDDEAYVTAEKESHE